MIIEKYTVEGPRHITGDAIWDNIDDARVFAQTHNLRLVALIFEFSDSELVEDYSDE